MKQTALQRIFVLACALSAAFRADAYTLVDGVLESSKIYPGTVHRYQISLPEGYDASKPACLYVCLDGVLCRAPERIDSLIAAGAMPPTIGVYLWPGVIRNAAGEVIRYNRSNEFDATDGRFATFLETELLPAVSATVLPDGRSVRFSDEASDRCIFGLSSGGIAAFNAAWQRPDLFGRVFSGCGTFVPMRGGHDLEAVVRKHEPKPLRIFLQDGFSDTWNPTFGSWYEHNRLLASALEFAGYECRFDWAEGGHSTARASAIFSQAMAWLWSGYPDSPAAGTTGNDTLAPLLRDASAAWTAVTPVGAEGSLAARIAYPDDSFAVVREVVDGHIDQAVIDSADGSLVCRQRFYWPHSYNDNDLRLGGMAFDADGQLWAVTDSGIQIFDQNGRVRGILELPVAIKIAGGAAHYGILLGEDGVTVSNGKQAFFRPLRVRAAQHGVRPVSQGQG